MVTIDKSVWLPYTNGMDKDISLRQKIGYDLLSLVMTFVDLDKKTRYYGTDVPIFYSEIHVISAIAKHSGIHVGGLADLLGITKGSVSEIIKKLERKALIVKKIDDRNLSRLSLRLTEKGEKAHSNHMRYHAVLNGIVEEELQTASEHDIQFLSHFLSTITAKAKKIDGNGENI